MRKESVKIFLLCLVGIVILSQTAFAGLGTGQQKTNMPAAQNSSISNWGNVTIVMPEPAPAPPVSDGVENKAADSLLGPPETISAQKPIDPPGTGIRQVGEYTVKTIILKDGSVKEIWKNKAGNKVKVTVQREREDGNIVTTERSTFKDADGNTITLKSWALSDSDGNFIRSKKTMVNDKGDKFVDTVKVNPDGSQSIKSTQFDKYGNVVAKKSLTRQVVNLPGTSPGQKAFKTIDTYDDGTVVESTVKVNLKDLVSTIATTVYNSDGNIVAKNLTVTDAIGNVLSSEDIPLPSISKLITEN